MPYQFFKNIRLSNMLRKQTTKLLPLLILSIFSSSQLVHCNVLFHFGFDFHVKTDSNEEHINKTIIVDNNQVSIKDNLLPDHTPEPLISITTLPPSTMSDIWAQQQNLNRTAAEQLDAARTALTQLNGELAPVVGRSDFIAAKVKLITRYLNTADAAVATASADGRIAHKFELLRNFVKLVDELKQPPAEALGGERTLEFTVLRLAMEKCALVKAQAEVQQQVLDAEQAWHQYVRSKLIEVAV